MAFKNPNEQAESMNMDEFSNLLGKATEKQTGSRFVLDKEKYPDVEETPYGFIYNVGGRSITDATAERMTWPKSMWPKESLGFRVAFGGDEVEYPTWEEAYKAAKGIK